MKHANLISIAKFRETYFVTGSAPSQSTVRRWILEGSIDGRIVRGNERDTFFVDAGSWERTTGNADVDEFLSTLHKAG